MVVAPEQEVSRSFIQAPQRGVKRWEWYQASQASGPGVFQSFVRAWCQARPAIIYAKLKLNVGFSKFTCSQVVFSKRFSDPQFWNLYWRTDWNWILISVWNIRDWNWILVIRCKVVLSSKCRIVITPKISNLLHVCFANSNLLPFVFAAFSWSFPFYPISILTFQKLQLLQQFLTFLQT